MRLAGAVDAQPACPLGVCDGSGWILGPEDVARPCECRERRLAAPARPRGVDSVIPAQVPGRQLRPAARHRQASTRSSCKRVARLPRGDRRASRRRARASGSRQRGHRQDDPRDAGLEDRAGSRAHGRDLLAPEAPRPDPRAPTTPRPASSPTRSSSSAWLASISSTSTTSAPRSAPTGCWSSSTRSSTSATRCERSMVVTTNLDQEASSRSRSGAHRLPPGRDLRPAAAHRRRRRCDIPRAPESLRDAARPSAHRIARPAGAIDAPRCLIIHLRHARNSHSRRPVG